MHHKTLIKAVKRYRNLKNKQTIKADNERKHTLELRMPGLLWCV